MNCEQLLKSIEEKRTVLKPPNKLIIRSYSGDYSVKSISIINTIIILNFRPFSNHNGLTVNNLYNFLQNCPKSKIYLKHISVFSNVDPVKKCQQSINQSIKYLILS